MTLARRRAYLPEVEDPFSLIGSTIDGKYRVDAAIGEGGFGIVYRGWHEKFRHPIAIKCLKVPAHFAAPAKQVFLDRFNEEGRTLFRLSEHPNIVRVFDCGVTASLHGHELPYLILEWLDGQSLDAFTAEKVCREGRPHTELEIVELMRPAIEALAFAHEQGVIHRDIKPDNLFVVQSADNPLLVKVLDFGIAKVVEDGDTEARKTAHSTFVAFSPSWAAPEQFYAKGYGATGRWTDVHALGLVFVFAVTGRSPLEGDELIELMRSALAERRPTPRSRGAWVSDAFEQLVANAIALRSADRFQDARALLSALVEFRDANAGDFDARVAGIVPNAQVKKREPTTLLQPSMPTVNVEAALPLRMAQPLQGQRLSAPLRRRFWRWDFLLGLAARSQVAPTTRNRRSVFVACGVALAGILVSAGVLLGSRLARLPLAEPTPTAQTAAVEAERHPIPTPQPAVVATVNVKDLPGASQQGVRSPVLVPPNLNDLSRAPKPSSPLAPLAGQCMTQGQLLQVIGQHKVAIRRLCWDGHRTARPAVGIAVSMTVAPDGTAQSVSASGDDPEVAKCIENDIRNNWDFGNVGCSQKVSIPFRFVR